MHHELSKCPADNVVHTDICVRHDVAMHGGRGRRKVLLVIARGTKRRAVRFELGEPPGHAILPILESIRRGSVLEVSNLVRSVAGWERWRTGGNIRQ